MTEDGKPPEEEFDTSDVTGNIDLTPPEGRQIDKELEKAVVVDHGNHIAKLEDRVSQLEDLVEHLGHELQRLRKHMASWVSS